MSTDAIQEQVRALQAELAALRVELEVAESALLRNGYRKTCDIAACNCGSQWNHGGNAEQRLSEIGEALRDAGFNGGTLLGNIETVCAERDALEAEVAALRADAERYRWLRGGSDVPPESHRWARWEVRYWRGRWWNTMFAESLDAAIDAAKEQR